MDSADEALETVASETAAGRLELVDLVKEFGNGDAVVRAVDGINLSVAPGEFLTLLGPSGCGKTTTLRMVAGFEDATSGRVDLDGVNMVETPPHRRPMAMVFQSYALFPHLTVRDNVAYGLKLKKLPAAEMNELVEVALTSMNLGPLADRWPNQLSGGQQQRVALARAMVMRPKVLLFDEPLSNLDAKLRVRMRLEIRRLQRRMGITSLYVTHDQAEAMSLSDRIVVMNAGKIEQADTPEMIYRQPESVFVADFIGRANFLDATVLSVADGIARILVLEKEYEVPAHRDVKAQTSTQLLVRPESFRIRPVSEGEELHDVAGDHGRILAAVFYGDNVEYEIETEHGTVVAIVPDPEKDSLYNEGDEVRLSFAADRAWLLAH